MKVEDKKLRRNDTFSLSKSKETTRASSMYIYIIMYIHMLGTYIHIDNVHFIAIYKEDMPRRCYEH